MQPGVLCKPMLLKEELPLLHKLMRNSGSMRMERFQKCCRVIILNKNIVTLTLHCTGSGIGSPVYAPVCVARI